MPTDGPKSDSVTRAGDGTPPAKGPRGRGRRASADRGAEGGDRRGAPGLPGEDGRARDSAPGRAAQGPDPGGSREARERAGPRSRPPGERPGPQDRRDQAAVSEVDKPRAQRPPGSIASAKR